MVFGNEKLKQDAVSAKKDLLAYDADMDDDAHDDESDANAYGGMVFGNEKLKQEAVSAKKDLLAYDADMATDADIEDDAHNALIDCDA